MNVNEPLPDLSQCAQEPIRVPGAIQPHGRLAVLSTEGRLRAYSENWADAASAAAAMQALQLDSALLVPGEGPAPVGALAFDGQMLEASAHVHNGLVLVELEPRREPPSRVPPIHALARHFLPQLEQAITVQQLSELAAAQMKRLTGFGRCLVYRFDAEDHGEVLAEVADEGYERYAGHRFPASDIPPQARELYRLNHIRLIPDARYQPVALRAVDATLQPGAIDLTYAGLRSVSPVHLEYMRNMGTLASMSVSIVVRGRLWGLVSCHDHAPRHLAYETRLAAEHLGRLLSLQIEAKEENAEAEARLELRQLILQIVAHLADSDGSLQRLVEEPHPLLRMARATGAAVVLNDECWTTGEAPPRDQVHEIARWVAHSGHEVVHTDRLAEVLPGAGGWGTAGVLAISISQVHRHQILWFRPEQVQTIQWAGDPRKPVSAADGRLHPRLSFRTWQQQVRGRSQPWTLTEAAAALELRQALIAIVLRRAEELNEVATELGRVNKELEAFSYTVSHDLRAPMRHIAGYVDLVLDMEGGQLTERAHRYLAHVKEAAAFAGQLVDALLDFSRLGRSALKHSGVELDVLVHDLVAELKQQERERAVEWHIEPGLPRLWADPFLVQVAVRNLLGNAVKYSRGREPSRIRIVGVRNAEGEGMEVTDNGVGFQMKYVGKLFGVFQRLHQAEEFEGTGIGLANVRRIIERHGGTVWAQGEIDKGATFGFTLPRRAAVEGV
jgi:light-regulated signal transduction histidine kinase (bacteriophytochrome)